MPVHAYTLRAGTTSKLFLVFARDAADLAGGRGKSGLSHAMEGGSAAYVRDDGVSGDVALGPAEAGQWRPGGLVEVDADLLPGVYQFGVPDEMLAPGANRALLLLRLPGAQIDPVDVDLVAFDPQDSVRLGMTALGPEARVLALRSAFPRLARREVQEPMEGPEARSSDALNGLGAAPGRATGPVRILRGQDDVLEIPAGAILVTRLLNPYMAPVFFRVAGVVTEEGGLLQHATTLAREFGVPAVVGCTGATEVLQEGERVEVRGDTGEVLRLDAAPG